MDKTVLLSGDAAVGKTAVLRWAIPELQARASRCALCKIDCTSDDIDEYASWGIPAVVGVSGDICPDHFLVSNLPELWSWAMKLRASLLFVETAGLCHRCSPATESMLAGCVVDCTASCKAPARLGPMLAQADFVVLSKIDMVSQAEREIMCCKINELCPEAELFAVDALAGYGIDRLCDFIAAQKPTERFEEDKLRHTMPSGVCSYCIGERRVGSRYQQGVVGKMAFPEDNPCAR